jgi:hypothetical protein
MPVWALSPAIVPHDRHQMNIPRRNGIHIETRAAPRKATSTLAHFMQQLALARALRPSHGSCWYFGEQRRFVSQGGKPVSPYICVCPPNELHAQCHGRGRRLPSQTQPQSPARDAPVKDQCHFNDSVAAYRHGLLLFENRGQSSDGMFLTCRVACSMAALHHNVLTVQILEHLLLTTRAAPLIWLGRPVRPLLHGLPGRFVGSPLDPLGQSRAARWFAEAMGTANSPGSQPAPFWLDRTIRALFASAK